MPTKNILFFIFLFCIVISSYSQKLSKQKCRQKCKFNYNQPEYFPAGFKPHANEKLVMVLNEEFNNKKLNEDLWRELVTVTDGKNIEWKRISGHSGVPANERCDVIATSFADSRPIVLYNGSRIRYGVDISVSSVPNSLEKKKNKDRSPAYSYVSLVDGEIMTHKTWEECKTRVNGVPKARFKKAISLADEEEIITEFTGG